MHETALNILLFVVFALLLGALVKAIMRNFRLPYTVVLLLIGIGGAMISRFEWVELGAIDTVLTQVGAIEPHLILYLFLPILIFESAYSMEPHLFFRIAPQIAVLAVIGLIISMILSALAIQWMLPWSLGVALLFGALGTTSKVQALPVIGEFLWVVCAGLFIGATIGWGILWIIGKLINQPLIEISLSIGAAYLTFIVAEWIHVSGVVGLVTLALVFATIGRTRISPAVTHFLHQFWEMMAYVANTLIFLIVGIVIALQVRLDVPKLWLALALLYVLLTLIRAVSIVLLMPILRRIGIGITKEKAIVLVWGGLRGAVSLSLALSIARDSGIPLETRDQILFLAAGIVVLTIVINGSTMEWLLRVLKLDRLPAAKEASVMKARQGLNQELSEFLSHTLRSPFFDKLEAGSITTLIDDPCRGGVCAPGGPLTQEDVDVAFMRRLLEIERSDYWRQFEEGYIGRQAAYILSRSVEQALDNSPVIAPRPDLDQILTVPIPPRWLHQVPMMGRTVQGWLFSRLSLGYDVARGFVEAQEEMRRHLEALCPNPEAYLQVEGMLDRNCERAFGFTRYLSQEHGGLIKSLQTRSAKRLLLNHERSLVWKMQHDGVLEEAEAQHLIADIEDQMVRMREEQREEGEE